MTSLYYIPLIYLGMLALVITVYQIVYNKHRKRIHEILEEVEDVRDRLSSLIKHIQRFDDNAENGEVYLLNDVDRNRFVVIRDGFIIKAVKYDPNDLDDREYKLIYIREVAEKLNEKP